MGMNGTDGADGSTGPPGIMVCCVIFLFYYFFFFIQISLLSIATNCGLKYVYVCNEQWYIYPFRESQVSWACKEVKETLEEQGFQERM